MADKMSKEERIAQYIVDRWVKKRLFPSAVAKLRDHVRDMTLQLKEDQALTTDFQKIDAEQVSQSDFVIFPSVNVQASEFLKKEDNLENKKQALDTLIDHYHKMNLSLFQTTADLVSLY